MNPTSRVLLLLGLSSLAPVAIAACGGDDSNTTPVGGPDGSTADALPAVDSGNDSGDVGVSDAPVAADSGKPARGIRLANMSASALDFCVRPPSGTYAGAAFAGSGGVAPSTVSAYVPFDGVLADFKFKLVPAGGSCDATDGGFNETTEPGNAAPLRSRWYVGTGSPLAGGSFDVAQPTAGKDTVVFDKMQSSNSTLQFVPDSDASAPVTIGAKTVLDPGVSGKLVGNVPGFGAPPERPFKGVSGGVVRVYLTGTTLLVCDELAPAVGTQSDCRTSVRAP